MEVLAQGKAGRHGRQHVEHRQTDEQRGAGAFTGQEDNGERGHDCRHAREEEDAGGQDKGPNQPRFFFLNFDAKKLNPILQQAKTGIAEFSKRIKHSTRRWLVLRHPICAGPERQ